MTDANYADLAQRIAALTEGEDDAVALMATVACELHHSDDRFDWTGFDRGVCGAAARTGEVQIVSDVHAFPDHIACSATTGSEIVLPVRDAAGEVIGVLDIDSDRPDAFGPSDAAGLAAILQATFAR